MSEPDLFNTPPNSKVDCYFDQVVEEDEAGLLQVTCTLTYQAQVTIMPPWAPCLAPLQHVFDAETSGN